VLHTKGSVVLLLGLLPLTFEVLVIYYPFVFSFLKDLSAEALFLVITNPLVHHAFEQSFVQATLGTLASVTLGYPLGLVLGLVNFRASSIYRALVFLPFLLPSIVVIVGFQEAYGFTWPFTLLTHGLTGITAINAYYNAPLVALLVASSLERLNPELVYAARTLGASNFKLLTKVVMPFTLGSLIVGALLAFVYSFLSFLVPLVIGGASHYTVEVEIYFFLRLGKFDQAIALSVLQLLSLVIVVVALIRLRGYGFSFGRLSSIRHVYQTLKAPIKALVYSFLLLFLFFEIYPLLSIAEHTLGFLGFRELLEASAQGALQTSLQALIANSVIFAVLSSSVSLALSICATHFVLSVSKPLRFYEVVMLLPILISPVSIGVALYLTYYSLSALNEVWLVIVFAQSAVSLPVAMRFLLEGLRRTPKELVFSSKVLGAGSVETLFRVEMPLNAHTISSSTAIALAVSLGEFAATNIVYIPKFATIPIAIFSLLEIRKLAAASALSLILIALALIAYYPVFRLGASEA
jgi:thiamine transport system permease protein